MNKWIIILAFVTAINCKTEDRDNEEAEKICELQLNALFEGVEKEQTWALIMYDAWGQQPSGLHSANLVNYGNFDQCYHFNYNHNEFGRIQGQNCLVPVNMQQIHTIKIPTYRMSICIPATCSPKNIRNLLQSHFNSKQLFIPEYDSTDTCEMAPTKYLPLFWITLSFFIVFALISIMATSYEVITLNRNSKAVAAFTSFSIYSNASRLFNYTPINRRQQQQQQQLLPTDNSASHSTFMNLNCLNGIRVLSTLAIIYQHTYYMQLSFPLMNENYKFQWAQQVFSMTYISSRIAVDVFLLVSGLLIAWNFLHDRTKEKPFNILKSYIVRYIRLTTALLPIVLFTVGMMRYVGSGPEWTPRTNQIIGFCDRYWWSALLHVQNYVNPFEICVGQSWYLSVDFQLYIISPLFLLPLWKYGDKFLWVILTLITAILLYVFLICIYKEIYISWFLRDTEDLYRYLYSGTHTRAMPWMIGVVLGYLLFKTQNKCIRIPKMVNILVWFVTVLIMLAIIFGPIALDTPTVSETKLETAFYQTFSSFFWTICTAWIIFACCHNYAGFINQFLSHSFWLPISQLSFCIYLVHLPLQYMMTASRKTSGYFNDLSALHEFCGDIGFAFVIGLIWHLVFENPFSILVKTYLRGG